MTLDKSSKSDRFFAEFKDPKKTALYGVVAVILSLFLLPYLLYSAGILLGIYGSYHSFRQKKWGLLVANLAVCLLAIWVKANFH